MMLFKCSIVFNMGGGGVFIHGLHFLRARQRPILKLVNTTESIKTGFTYIIYFIINSGSFQVPGQLYKQLEQTVQYTCSTVQYRLFKVNRDNTPNELNKLAPSMEIKVIYFVSFQFCLGLAQKNNPKASVLV